MRILHVTDHYPPVTGGIELHVADLAARQEAAGHTVRVLTSTPSRAEGRWSDDSGPVEVLRARSLSEGWRTGTSDVDVVHAHVSVVAPFTAPVAAALARRGVPTVVTVHSLWNGLGPLPTWAAALAGLRSAPVTWSAVSRLAAGQVAPRLRAGTSVQVLPNAVDAAPRASTPPVHDSVRIVSTLRLAARKRPLELLRIFDRLQASAALPVELVLVGDGPLRPRVEHEVRRRGLGHLVTLRGGVDNPTVRRILAESDVYVAPARLESFGLAALEARAVGLPVVGLATTGLTEFVRDGVEGLLAHDDRGLRDAVARLVREPALRTRISEHNRTVPSTHTWPRALHLHDRTYETAVEARPRTLREVVAP
ncbi:glycosyltransferase family 4 protein [Nocardioides panacis]|uniref:Glycosyltransferase family 4 protein n=1 Tax=Nocardioides panacis TaxID=2849501 RepID=A0A975T1Q9_9ACTN|nr:glycosyltransferase family 4 protein [Nocardioides panacis]QWZ09989.1 glycosyltransferase family 4 protein [Nocardioides panacis]